MNTSLSSQSNQPAISICMPVYNGRRFLQNAFATLARQSFRDFEVIVVDDGSADDSGSLAEDLMTQYQLQGRVFRIPNGGCEQARDLACENARAKVIAPFDCDDEWCPNYLEDMFAVLRDNESVGLVYCDFLNVYKDGIDPVPKSESTSWIDLTSSRHSGDLFVFESGTFFEMLLQGQVLFPPCTMFRKALYEAAGKYAAGLPDLRISLDWSFGLRASRLSSVAFLRRSLLLKSSHDRNTSGDNFKTSASDVVVLKSLLKDNTLSKRQRMLARGRAAQRALNAGYELWAEQSRSQEARTWFVNSLRFSFSFRAATLVLLSFLPPFLIKRLRTIKSSIKL